MSGNRYVLCWRQAEVMLRHEVMTTDIFTERDRMVIERIAPALERADIDLRWCLLPTGDGEVERIRAGGARRQLPWGAR
jgi:hypothetical protein